MMMMRRSYLLIVLPLILIFSLPAFAIDWSVYQNPSGNLKNCLREHLNPNVLAKLSDGERPQKKGLRKKAKKALKACGALRKRRGEAKKKAPPFQRGIKVKKSYLGSAPMYEMVRPDSQANLIFFNGGPGWGGNLKSKNFLIRERRSFFFARMNVFLFPNPEKKVKLSFDDRLEETHANSIRELVKDIRSQNNLPIYLVGISRGTVSVGNFITRYGNEVDGVVLMSGVYLNSRISKRAPYSMQHVIGTKTETNILVLHHEDDACKICQPSSAEEFYEELETENKKLIFVSGGGASGDPHGPLHHHGFEDVESVAVGHLVDWVLKK